jgi:Flp pilus assembly protein TadG
MASLMKQRIKRNMRGRSGAALVELAIALPILLLLTLGLIEYGWIFLCVSKINMAARQGVRVAVRPGATETQLNSNVSSMMNEAGMGSSGYVLTHTSLTVEVGQPVTVQINVNYGPLSLTGTSLVPLPTQLQGRATMAKEGEPPATPAP